MAKLSEEHLNEIKANIKSLLVRLPEASARQIANILGHDKTFISEQIKVIRKENAALIEKGSLLLELAYLQLIVNELSRSLWKIIENDQTNVKDQINALKTIFWANSMLFEKKLDSGIMNKKEQVNKIVMQIVGDREDRQNENS